MTNLDLEIMSGGSYTFEVTVQAETPSGTLDLTSGYNLNLGFVPGGSGSGVVVFHPPVSGSITYTTGPLDLGTVAQIEFCIKKAPGAQSPMLVYKRLGSGIELVGNGSAGKLRVVLLPEDTGKLPVQSAHPYEYDLWLVYGASRIPVLRGKLTLLSAVNTEV